MESLRIIAFLLFYKCLSFRHSANAVALVGGPHIVGILLRACSVSSVQFPLLLQSPQNCSLTEMLMFVHAVRQT